MVGLTKAAVAKILDKEGATSAGYSTVEDSGMATGRRCATYRPIRY